jgi:hypothetical protein
MNDQKTAFSLFLFCIYLSLVVVLVSTSLPLFFRISTDMMRISYKQTIALELSKTMTIIAHILKNIDPQYVTYHDAQMLVWHKQEHDQGFVFDVKNSKLYFIQGMYDKGKKQWKQGKKSLLSYHVTPLFSFYKEPCPSFSITLTHKEQSVSQYVIPILGTYRLKKEKTV